MSQTIRFPVRADDGAVRLHAVGEHTVAAVGFHHDQPAARRAAGPVAARRILEPHVGEVQLPLEPRRSLREREPVGELLRALPRRDDPLERRLLHGPAPPTSASSRAQPRPGATEQASSAAILPATARRGRKNLPGRCAMRNTRCGAAIMPRHVPERRAATAVPPGVRRPGGVRRRRRHHAGAVVHGQVVDRLRRRPRQLALLPVETDHARQRQPACRWPGPTRLATPAAGRSSCAA